MLKSASRTEESRSFLSRSGSLPLSPSLRVTPLQYSQSKLSSVPVTRYDYLVEEGFVAVVLFLHFLASYAVLRDAPRAFRSPQNILSPGPPSNIITKMRYISSIVSVAALASIAAAGDAPVVEGNPIEITYSATIPQVNAQDLSGAVKISSAPDGEGVNIQVSLYNLPSGQKLSTSSHKDSFAYHETYLMRYHRLRNLQRRGCLAQ